MPMLDMNLTELQNYQGSSPRPTDFDSFWAKALSEMQDLGTEHQLQPASFKAPGVLAYDLFFHGVGGSRIHAKYLQPTTQQEAAPALLQFHGYSASSGDWLDKYAYARAGYHVFAMDCRGQGGQSEDLGGRKGTTLNGHIIRGIEEGPQSLLFRDIFLDTAQLAQIAMSIDGIDPARVSATGASQGGALTIACAALVPELHKAAAIYPFLSDYRRVWEMDMAERAYAEIKEYFRRFDPTHQNEEAFFNTLSYIDIQNLAPRIKADTLWFCSLMDDVCPPSSQYAAFNKITAPKEMIIYHDYKHEWLPDAGDTIFSFLLG